MKLTSLFSVLTAIIAMGVLPQAAHALHRETPGAVQVTNGVSHTHPSGRSWGNYLAFSSSQDLANTGNTTKQVFVFNLAAYDCEQGTTEPTTPCPAPGTPAWWQVTTGAGAPDNASAATPSGSCSSSTKKCVGGPFQGNVCTDTSDCQAIDDVWVAFDALGSFTGGGVLGSAPGQAAGRRQIYMANIRTGVFQRMTTAGDGDSQKPSLSSQGGIVVYESTSGTLGGTPAGVSQVYVQLRAAATPIRLSRCGGGGVCVPSGPSRNAMPNQDGSRIVFESRADLLGDGHDTGIWQIYLATFNKQSGAVALYRLTNGNGDSTNPTVADSAPVVAFDSKATNLPGTSGQTGRRIVVADVRSLGAPILTELTTPAVYGDCSSPALNPGADVDNQGELEIRATIICTGDPLQNGTTGNRVFVVDTVTPTLYQITGAGDVEGPVAANLGQWFLSLSTSSDLNGGGVCGYQLYVINYNTSQNAAGGWLAATSLGQLPPDSVGQGGSSTIGLKNFSVAPGSGGTGSTTSLTSQDGGIVTSVTSSATIGLDIGAPSGFSGEATLTVPADRVVLPPVPVAGFGAICFQAAGNGLGLLDCDGGAADGNVTLVQDHNIDAADPSCVTGCREDDPSCQGALTGPHSGDVQGVCNGPVVPTLGGAFAAGGVRATLPVTFTFSVNPGLDGQSCTGDDTYSAIQNVPAQLYLTTGTMTGRILDRDDVAGETLETVATGAPFDCDRLRAGDLSGARLVGSLPILDVPNVPGLRDVLIGFDFEASPSAPNSCGQSCNTSADCNDGDFCNGTETCGVNRRCVAGTPPQCDDGNVCNGSETCNSTLGACQQGTPLVCNDGNACNGVETCEPSLGCETGTPVVCNDPDNDVCTGVPSCNPSSGACDAGSAPALDDDNPCTDDTCHPTLGVQHTPNTASCDDGNACTQNDVCGSGTCAGSLTPAAITCNAGDGNLCNGNESCNPATGACQAGTPPTVDDNNPCTDDSCSPTLGVQHVANTAPCSDGNLCTLNDVCSGGTCGGTPKTCADANLCNGNETCNPATGACQAGAPVDCNDDNPCTDETCTPGTGTCAYTFNTDPCDDQNACTGTSGMPDTCIDGSCQPGGMVSCNDGNTCTGTETCDPEDGCQPGTPLACSDGNPCNGVETCSPEQSGCVSGEPLACDDGNTCNGTETCDPSSGCVAGSTPSCDDGNPCTADSCDDTAPGGCKHVPLDAVPCDDGSACTLGDVCTAGVCGGTPQTCGDDNLCNGTEECNDQTGVCEAGSPVVCDDADECTIDNPCDPVLGCSFTRVPNFVVCRLDQLTSLVRAADPFDLGGRKRQKVLLKRLAGARKKAQMGLIGTGARAVQNLRKADRRLQSFMGLLQLGIFKGRVNAEMGNKLLGLAADTEGELTTLVRDTPR